MTKLSVNINKFATLRNARGGNNPNLLSIALDCERFGAQGITVHPRPDERHIRQSDVLQLSPLLYTELNIEGYPSEEFLRLVEKVKPAQVTLVPDPPHVLTSNAGWNTIQNASFLNEIAERIRLTGARVSIFIAPRMDMIDQLIHIKTDRIELYTEEYARQFNHDAKKAVLPYFNAAQAAYKMGFGINAGHDLDLQNLSFLVTSIPFISEVSIGHALVCDALYYGLENTIQLYKRALLGS